MSNRRWPAYERSTKAKLRSVPWRGPNRILTYEEQIEIQRAIREARPEGQAMEVATQLARRHGVSVRTIWRYGATAAVPPGFEVLRVRISHWAEERGLELTYDDMAALLLLLRRHRDMAGQDPRSIEQRAREARELRMRRIVG